MAVLDFKRSTNTPSTLAKGTLQFVDVGGRFKMLIGDNSNAPREANYLPFQGGMLTGALTSYTTLASPLILLRDGGDVGINMNGRYLGNSNGVLRFGSNSTHANNNEVWHSGNLRSNAQNDAAYMKTVTLLGNNSIDTALSSGIYRNENGLGGNIAFAPVLSLNAVDTGLQITGGFTYNELLFRGWGSAGQTFTQWNSLWHSGTTTIKNPTIEATAALIIPTVAPVNPEANKVYLYLT